MTMNVEKRTVRRCSGGMAATRRLMRWRVGPQMAAMPATATKMTMAAGMVRPLWRQISSAMSSRSS